MLDAYAVIPDGTCAPAAVFVDLEEAIDWGLTRYGSDSFHIKGLVIEPVAADWKPAQRRAS